MAVNSGNFTDRAYLPHDIFALVIRLIRVMSYPNLCIRNFPYPCEVGGTTVKHALVSQILHFVYKGFGCAVQLIEAYASAGKVVEVLQSKAMGSSRV